MSISPGNTANPPPQGSPVEVLMAFLKLGLTSFGGPIAHLGYFRAEFVERRRWLNERAYVDLVALCQFLPGPASSQTGFAIGLMRGGYLGGLAAWIGFTTPSAVLLLLFAYGAGSIADSPLGAGLLHGLQTGRRRHCRAGRVGHGTQSLPGQTTCLDSGSRHHNDVAGSWLARPGRRNCAWRRGRVGILPRRCRGTGG